MAGSGELTKRSDGTWGFAVKSPTGETVATDAGEGFATQADARLVLETLLGGGYDGPIVSEATITCGQEITEDTTLEGDLVCTGGPALVIAADNITVDLGGFTVSGEGPGAATAPGIVFRNVKGCTLQKGTVTGFGAGVAVNGGSNNVVQNVTAQDNVGPAGGDFGDGIVVNDSSGNRIEGNTVARNGPYSGISLVGTCTTNQILQNVVTDNNMLPGDPQAGRQDMGIRVEGPAADNNTIRGNTVTGSGADGIVVLPTCYDTAAGCAGTPPNEGNEITANTSHRNGTSGRGDGIRLFTNPAPVAPAHTTITDNTTDDNTTHGISIDAVGDANPGPPENHVSGNSAHGNGGFDGFDANTPACGSNVWEGNDFGTVNQPCVQGGGTGGDQTTIGPVELRIDLEGTQATVHVTYDITFGEQDVQSNQVYSEVCRIIGDDTDVGDTPAAGGDDTLGFLTPLFNDNVTPNENSPTASRHFMKTIRKQSLDEDRGSVPNPDEIRATVTLTPRSPTTGEPIRAESNMVSLEI